MWGISWGVGNILGCGGYLDVGDILGCEISFGGGV